MYYRFMFVNYIKRTQFIVATSQVLFLTLIIPSFIVLSAGIYLRNISIVCISAAISMFILVFTAFEEDYIQGHYMNVSIARKSVFFDLGSIMLLLALLAGGIYFSQLALVIAALAICVPILLIARDSSILRTQLTVDAYAKSLDIGKLFVMSYLFEYYSLMGYQINEIERLKILEIDRINSMINLRMLRPDFIYRWK